MTFEKYCQLMRTRGIDELFFFYNNKEYYINADAENFPDYVAGKTLVKKYFVEYENAEFDSLDELLQAAVFDGKTLEQIWPQIKYATYEGKSDEDFLSDLDSSTFEERMAQKKERYLQENGVEQVHIFLTSAQCFWLSYLCAFIGVAIFLLILSIPGFCGFGWYYMLVIGFITGVIYFIVVPIMIWKNNVCINYLITDKKIEIYDGLTHITKYDNIRKVTMRKYRGKKGYGAIRIYVRKGLSLNFWMTYVPDVENVYRLIKDNIANICGNQNKQ